MTTSRAPETPRPVTVPTLQDRARCLEPLGWSGRKAEWIALVALHTGVFTRSQWCHFFDGANREAARVFVRALIDKKLAIEDERAIFPGGARAVLLTGKDLYRALGIPDVRHRRGKNATTHILMRRLLSLDYLIERPTLGWLPTEADKVRRFEALGIDRAVLPYRKYGEGEKGQPRYFALKLPIAIDARAATFVYVDAGQSTDSELRAWGVAHAPLWAALRARTFAVHVVAVGTGVDAAERAAPALKRWTQDGDGQGAADPAALTYLNTHTITHARERIESTSAQEIRLRVEAVHRWYVHDWNTLDNKIRSSIVEGVSVFLSMFDLPSVARVFCPAAPEARRFHDPAGDAHDAPGTDTTPLAATAMKGVDLPPLDALIERGKVLALNMPAGTNPALARAVGVMLKNAWLQSLLRRPAAMMQAEPGRYVRPAVFICDEYQAFASVGEDDPSGDEKAFALTRQCRVIPIVATQSISSLRSVLGSSEAWRTLLQTLRTRIFLSLSDEASAEIASKLCGQVRKLKATYAINETSRQSGINFLSAQAGGGRGSVGASKSFTDHREAVFQPRDFALLGNCQAICLPYDGVQSLPPRRVYLKPHYLPAGWHAKRTGQL